MPESMPHPQYRFGSENPHTHDYLAPAVVQALLRLQARTVLDIGCGNGALAKALAGHGLTLTGMDSSESGIAAARQALPAARFYCMGLEENPAAMAEKDFDAVVSTEVIEHLFLPRQLLDFASAKLRPGGTLLLTTPYHGYLKNLVLSLCDRWDPHFSPAWDGGHIKFWSRRTLTRFLRQADFEVVGFTGLGRLPYLWKSMLLVARKVG